MPKKNDGSHLKKYVTKAKQLQKDHPKTKWSSLMKQAGEELNKKKKTKTHKKK